MGPQLKKSHPTDWEKSGIEPATPGLQDKGLSPTQRRLLEVLFRSIENSNYREADIKIYPPPSHYQVVSSVKHKFRAPYRPYFLNSFCPKFVLNKRVIRKLIIRTFEVLL